jgi:hypothetical protein
VEVLTVGMTGSGLSGVRLDTAMSATISDFVGARPRMT